MFKAVISYFIKAKNALEIGHHHSGQSVTVYVRLRPACWDDAIALHSFIHFSFDDFFVAVLPA